MKKSYLFLLSLVAWSFIAQAQVTEMEPEETPASAEEVVSESLPPLKKAPPRLVPTAPAAPEETLSVREEAPSVVVEDTSTAADEAIPTAAPGAKLKITVYQGNSDEHVIVESSDRSIYKRLLTSTGIALPDMVPKYAMPSETSTYTGVFQVIRMDANASSNLYENSPMNNAVFFTHGGIALHESNQGVTGMPRSHGCVRLLKDDAKFVFDTVKAYGPKNTTIEVIGTVRRTEQEMRKAFARLDDKLLAKHYQLWENGQTVVGQPDRLKNKVTVYGRVYYRHPETLVYLPESYFDPDSDYVAQARRERDEDQDSLFSGLAKDVGQGVGAIGNTVGKVVKAPFKLIFGDKKKKEKKKKKKKQQDAMVEDELY